MVPLPSMAGLRRLRGQRCRLYVVVVAAVALLAAARLLLIHHYVGWRFLWGGDQVPVLNKEALLRDVFTYALPWRDMGIIDVPQLGMVIVNYAAEKFFEAVTGQHPIPYNVPGWLANTLLYALGLLIVWYVSSVYGFRGPRVRLAVFLALALMVSYNPWSTIDTFKSYLGSTSFQAMLSLALFAYYISLVRYAAEGRPPPLWEAALAAAAVAVAASSPSGSARAVASTLLATLLASPFVLAARPPGRRGGPRRLLLYVAAPLVLAAAVFSLYTASGYLEALTARVHEQLGTRPLQAVLHPRYAEPVYALAAWTSWIAHSPYMPYHELYEHGVLALLLYAWPLAALTPALLLLAARREPSRARRLQLLLLLVYVAVFTAWSTAGNEPLSWLKTMLLTRAPLLLKVYPPGIGSMYVKISYMFLIGYLVGRIVEELQGLRGPAAASLLLAALISTALPIFNGSVFGQYFNQEIKGFMVPEEYRLLENLETRFYEHILLLPATDTYASTSWGWQGAVTWYHYLNPAILVKSIAAYSQYTPWATLYRNLTSPCITLDEPRPLPGLAEAKPVVQGGEATVTTSNNTVTIHVHSAAGNKLAVVLALPAPVDISAASYIAFKACLRGGANAAVKPYIYLVSGRVAGVHILPELRPGECAEKVYRVGVPDKPWPASMYMPERVNAVIVELRGEPRQLKGLDLSLEVMVSNSTGLCRSYLELLRLVNVKYVVVDKTLHGRGLSQALLDALRHSLKQIFNGTVLEVYAVDAASSPIQGVDARVEALLASPTRVEVTAEPLHGGAAELCAPLLNLPGAARPLELIRVKPVPGLLQPMEGRPLICARPGAYARVTVQGYMPTAFRLVYVLQVLVGLLPLPLLAYVGVEAARSLGRCGERGAA